MRGRLWVFAGPNGAGKSTLVARLVRSRMPVINPDELAGNLPAASNAARLTAGREALFQRDQLLTSGATFGVETTLSGRTEVDLVHRAAQKGYRVSLIYIGLRNVQLSIGRVRIRVANGGHDVPVSDLLRRYDRSLRGLQRLAPVVDRLIIVDNSGTLGQLLFWRDGERIRRFHEPMADWAKDAVKASAAKSDLLAPAFKPRT